MRYQIGELGFQASGLDGQHVGHPLPLALAHQALQLVHVCADLETIIFKIFSEKKTLHQSMSS
jgi:hypothetical protein